MGKRTRIEYISLITDWLINISAKRDPELASRARESTGLDGVYRGGSARIRRMVTLAYLRGVRRGASCAWEAAQPITLQSSHSPPQHPEPGDKPGEPDEGSD